MASWLCLLPLLLPWRLQAVEVQAWAHLAIGPSLQRLIQQCMQLQGPPAGADVAAFARGRHEGWLLDYWSGEGERKVDEVFLDRLKIY